MTKPSEGPTVAHHIEQAAKWVAAAESIWREIGADAWTEEELAAYRPAHSAAGIAAAHAAIAQAKLAAGWPVA